ncbi:MAG: anthranilate phosphoribosyltransferase [Micrococcales bacterium 73-13]|nr:MAG: anthranilate phosphoribosyltransferase [Micrococcales bacterium 73-13]
MTSEPTWPAILGALVSGEHLSIAEAGWAMGQVMAGTATPSQLGALLIALRIKGETVDEVVGFRDAALAHAAPLAVPTEVLDIVGTGGDPHGVLNISSAAAVIAAAAGVPVVKHGNRAASSRSGASDVLVALGVDIEIPPARAAEVLAEVGVTFANAAVHHPGFRHAGPTRREIGVSTLFNVLGPLCNPARPEASAVGVADLARVPLIVGVFQTRGATALVYRGDDGIDKLTTTGHSHIWEVTAGAVQEHDIDPVELGIPRAAIEDIVGDEPERNAEAIRAVLAGERGPHRDVILLNTAAGLAAYELWRRPEERFVPLRERLATQLRRAEGVVDSGLAAARLEAWAAATQRS